MEQPKEYYAFISYKREDKKEARRLQHALEYYRLPNYLRQDNPELTKYVCLVFRDMTDLKVGEQPALTVMCELIPNNIGGIMGIGTSIHSFWVGYTIKRGKKEYGGTNNNVIDKNVIRIWQRKIITN